MGCQNRIGILVYSHWLEKLLDRNLTVLTCQKSSIWPSVIGLQWAGRSRAIQAHSMVQNFRPRVSFRSGSSNSLAHWAFRQVLTIRRGRLASVLQVLEQCLMVSTRCALMGEVVLHCGQVHSTRGAREAFSSFPGRGVGCRKLAASSACARGQRPPLEALQE
jgi:hypothetical protein